MMARLIFSLGENIYKVFFYYTSYRNPNLVFQKQHPLNNVLSEKHHPTHWGKGLQYLIQVHEASCIGQF